MADETQQPAAGAVTDAGGGTLRVTPNTAAETPNPSVEEQAAAQALANETPEDKTKREAAEAAAAAAKEPVAETPEAKAAREAAEAAAKDEPIDFKGTVFEGLNEEMQGKIAPFAKAFAAQGSLTDEQVTQAAKDTGFSEGMVRQFMAGAGAQVAASAAPVFEAFDGEPNFRAFQTWSQTEGNLTPAEDRALNKALAAGDMETFAQLTKAPMDRWKAAGGGVPPRDVTSGSGAGGSSGAEVGDVFKSWAEAVQAQSKPEYRTNPTYRDEVVAKIARSKLG